MTFFLYQMEKNPHKKGGAGEPSRPAGDYEKNLSNCTWQLHLMMQVYRENVKEVFPGYEMFVTNL